jgi:hypothetical protein
MVRKRRKMEVVRNIMNRIIPVIPESPDFSLKLTVGIIPEL